MVASLFAAPAAVAASQFVTSGLPADLRLGSPAPSIVSFPHLGSLTVLAAVHGCVELPMAFTFAGAEAHIAVNAVVGTASEQGKAPAVIALSTSREGSVGGRFSLVVDATIESFKFEDESIPGGFADKTILIEGKCANVRVIARGRANRSSWVLRIGGAFADRALLTTTDGGGLQVTTDYDSETRLLTCVVADES